MLCHLPQGKTDMQCLCFDIETTGLDAARDDVTMVCCEDVATGERTTYNFGILCKRNESCDKLLESLIRQFDEATCLCAFNGIRFDLPFLHQALQIHSDIITRWVMKTVDPLEFLRLSGHRTSSLDKICTHNHIESKSSSGQHAVEMAQAEMWDELEDYCKQDVSILCGLIKRRTFHHPGQDTVIDLKECMPDWIYT
jgi:DNA polymerase III alpha subunit (gram-positive type)